MSTQDSLSPHVRKVFDAAVDTIDWATIPICFFKDGKLTHDRTGVLLQIGDFHFVITAAHNFKAIFDAGYEPCITMPEKGLLPVPMVCEDIKSTNSDVKDVSVALLLPETVRRIEKHYRPIRLSDVVLRDDPQNQDAYFLINGFPVTMEDRDDDGARRNDVWRCHTVRFDGDYGDVEDYDPLVHLVVKYDRDAENAKGKVIHPKGMSGGGIWLIKNHPNDLSVGKCSFYLVAIQNKWSKEFEYAKGTWMDTVLSIIWRHFPQTNKVMRLHEYVLPNPPDWL